MIVKFLLRLIRFFPDNLTEAFVDYSRSIRDCADKVCRSIVVRSSWPVKFHFFPHLSLYFRPNCIVLIILMSISARESLVFPLSSLSHPTTRRRHSTYACEGLGLRILLIDVIRNRPRIEIRWSP